jgi:hypothetical protein
MTHLVFVAAVLGTKVVLALWIIYYLFPSDSSCPDCDGETLPIQMRAARDGAWRLVGAALFLGKVRLRWCPSCEWEGFARPVRRTLPVPSLSGMEHPADHPTPLL